jgi:hypothetical protein
MNFMAAITLQNAAEKMTKHLIETAPEYFEQTPQRLAKPIRCPVCNGRGTCSAGFYDGEPHDDDHETVVFPAKREQCRSCKGGGILWERVAQ